jgi:hypothetical protein
MSPQAAQGLVLIFFARGSQFLRRGGTLFHMEESRPVRSLRSIRVPSRMSGWFRLSREGATGLIPIFLRASFRPIGAPCWHGASTAVREMTARLLASIPHPFLPRYGSRERRVGVAIAARIAGVSSVMVGFIITLSAGAVLDSAHWEADDLGSA